MSQMSPTPSLTTVITFNDYLTTLLETLADLDRDITNLTHHHSTNPALLSSSPPSPPSPTSKPASVRKVKALRVTARGIAARLQTFEKDLEAAEKRAEELKEKHYRPDETDKEIKQTFEAIFDGVGLCGRGFAELKGWWVGVVREGTTAVWAEAPVEIVI